ncbi:MAG: hypothetical protein CMP58_03565 [Flavobacteriales bacterium]|nr:hypothetical protein [Flavobacteriales bacterium]
MELDLHVRLLEKAEREEAERLVIRRPISLFCALRIPSGHELRRKKVRVDLDLAVVDDTVNEVTVHAAHLLANLHRAAWPDAGHDHVVGLVILVVVALRPKLDAPQKDLLRGYVLHSRVVESSGSGVVQSAKLPVGVDRDHEIALVLAPRLEVR